MACCGTRDKPCYRRDHGFPILQSTGPPNKLKIVLIGTSGIGKSSITLQYVRGEFNENSDMTIGAAYFYKTLEVNGEKIKLDIWDTAGQDRFKSVTVMFYRGAAGAVVCYDITDRNSFNEAQNWIKQVLQNTTNPVQICLVGNKLDLETKRAVSTEEGRSLADRNGYLFIETSAKTAENVHDLFANLVTVISCLQDPQTANQVTDNITLS